MMPVDDMIKILNIGYSFEDALKIAAAMRVSEIADHATAPAPAPTTDPAPAPTTDPAPAPAPPSSKEEAYGPALTDALRELTDMIRGGNINGVEFSAPMTTQDQADRAVVNIINPPRRDRNGG